MSAPTEESIEDQIRQAAKKLEWLLNICPTELDIEISGIDLSVIGHHDPMYKYSIRITSIQRNPIYP